MDNQPEKIKKIWNLSEKKHGLLSHQICEMKFYPEGFVYPHVSQKGILWFLLFEFTNYRMKIDKSNSIVIPIYDHKNKIAYFKYTEYAKLCRYKTITTFKKYLNYLYQSGFIILFPHEDKQYFGVQIIEERIKKCPKFENIDNE